MSEELKPSTGPFDVDTVRHLVRLMRKFDLSEVDLQDGEKRLKLRRGPKTVAAAFPTPVAYTPPSTPIPTTTPQAETGRKLLDIKSNMVGNFFAKPAPDKDDYVKVGTRVNPDTIVCKIEAMKIFNDLAAGVSGTIAEICVQNSSFVEYDQVLFRVEPS